jgi:hypothetical protein
MRRRLVVSGFREGAMTDHSLRTLLAQIVGASMPVALGACGGVATTRVDMTSAHAPRPDAKSDHESNRWIA